MALVVQGTQVTEFDGSNPSGVALKGEGETNLASHREALLSVQDRQNSKGKPTTGFADTPQVERAFESLKRHKAEEAIDKTAKAKGPAKKEAK